jgi:hypothetical protein
MLPYIAAPWIRHGFEETEHILLLRSSAFILMVILQSTSLPGKCPFITTEACSPEAWENYGLV